MKTILYIIYGLLFLLVGVLAARFILGGPEDSWICSNGAWVKHGNPSASMPTSGCVASNEENVTPDSHQPD
jgi:hypothetical protein